MDIKQFILNYNNNICYTLFECSRKNIKNNKYILSSNNKFYLINLIRNIVDNEDKHYLIYHTGCSYVEEYNNNGYFLKNHDKTFFLI